MHLPPEELLVQTKEPLPVSREGFEEGAAQWRTTETVAERQKARIDNQRDEIYKLRVRKERYEQKYKEAKERIAELEHHIDKASKTHQEALKQRDQHIRAVTDQLTRAEELLAMRSAELSAAQSFLSTTDRLSETEVLGIVRDLNENIFQVAANLTEEWEKLGDSGSTVTKDKVDVLSQHYGPALIQLALNRDPTGVTFLVQSCLCNIVTEITSRWRYGKLAVLGSVYKRLSASEEQAISARWRSLTHNYLSQPPPDSPSVVQHVGDVLWITGAFSSHPRSYDFVKRVALKGIETIARLALRLELAFMVEVASSDMSLLFEPPRTVFDKTRMINEFDEDSTPGARDEVAGTIEVGVGKCAGGGRSEGRCMEVLLKAKIILEKDIAEL